MPKAPAKPAVRVASVRKRIDTMFLLGVEIIAPLLPQALAMDPSSRDHWAEEQLKSAGVRLRSNTYASLAYQYGTLVGIRCTTVDYKPAAFERAQGRC